MRIAATPNSPMRVVSAVQGNTPTGYFRSCIATSFIGSWDRVGGYSQLLSGGFSQGYDNCEGYSSGTIFAPIPRQIPAQWLGSPLFLKPPTYYTVSTRGPIAPSLQQISLLERQMAGRLKETPEAYIFVKSSTAVNTAEAILKDLLELLKLQAELLKNSDDLTIRYYDADDVAYPVEGGISFVEHSDFAWVQKQLFRRDRDFDLGRLNERTLY